MNNYDIKYYSIPSAGLLALCGLCYLLGGNNKKQVVKNETEELHKTNQGQIIVENKTTVNEKLSGISPLFFQPDFVTKQEVQFKLIVCILDLTTDKYFKINQLCDYYRAKQPQAKDEASLIKISDFWDVLRSNFNLEKNKIYFIKLWGDNYIKEDDPGFCDSNFISGTMMLLSHPKNQLTNN